MQGQCIRAEIKWIEDGEKPFKYFTSLESINYISKQISQVVKDDGQVVSEQFKSLDETKSFYEQLYKKGKLLNQRFLLQN